MSNNVTLEQLAAELAQLRHQLEQVNQRLDTIYGAINRLSETQSTSSPDTPEPALSAMSAQTMMNPGSLLHSLRQHALEVGLELPNEAGQPDEAAQSTEESDRESE
jgi:uncharacterized coiled-coil protein SlyX